MMMRGVVVMAVALLCAVPARAQDRPLPGKKLAMMSRGARQTTVFIAKARLDTSSSPRSRARSSGSSIRPRASPGSSACRRRVWSSNAHGTVFKFKNPSAPGGSSPVKAALVKHKSGITVIAKTTGITLDEPTQGSVGLVLAFGALHYCALFGGEVVQDEPGKFVAKKAPAPAGLLGSVGCGSGLIDGDEQCEEDADCGVQKQCLQCQCVVAGDVGVSLLWSDTNDLDLHVIDPSGEEITWFNRSSASGGMLDVDANPGCFTPTTMPLENVFWPVGGAPHGTYVVRSTSTRSARAAPRRRRSRYARSSTTR